MPHQLAEATEVAYSSVFCCLEDTAFLKEKKMSEIIYEPHLTDILFRCQNVSKMWSPG